MTIFTQYNIRRPLLSELDAPTGDALRASFEQSFQANPFFAALRWAELRTAERIGRGELAHPELGLPAPELPPILSAEEARAKVAEYGLDLEVPDEGVPQQVLDLLIERKRAERVRQDTLSRAPEGFGNATARLAVGLGASLLDPLNIGSAFIPVVGPTRYAAMLARAGNVAARIPVRAGVGVAEGVFGAALVEPIVYGAMTAEQADYDLVDSLLNVALGGVLGGGLHVVGGTALDIVQGRRAADAPPPSAIQRGIENAAPETREAALRVGVAQLVEGRSVNVESVLFLDPVVRAARDAPESFSSDVGWRARMEIEDTARLAAQPNRPPVLDQQSPEYQALNYYQQAIEDNWALGVRAGVVDDVERMAAEGLTARQTANKLGPRLAVVDRNAQLRGEAFNAGGDKDNVVRAVRGKLGIPSMDERADYAKWLAEYQARPAAAPQARPAAKAAAAGPVDQRAWANVVSDAQTGGVQLSSLADVNASRQADELLKTATKSDTPEGLEAEAQEAFDSVRELAEALGNTQTLDALTREADLITQEAESLGKAARALAACQLRRGVT